MPPGAAAAPLITDHSLIGAAVSVPDVGGSIWARSHYETVWAEETVRGCNRTTIPTPHILRTLRAGVSTLAGRGEDFDFVRLDP